MHIWKTLVRAPSIGFWHKVGNDVIETRHAFKLAIHHPAALFVESDFQKERLWRAIFFSGFKMGSLGPKTRAVWSDSDDTGAFWQF